MLWLVAAKAEKERMKVKIASMLKSFQEQTYQMALRLARARSSIICRAARPAAPRGRPQERNLGKGGPGAIETASHGATASRALTTLIHPLLMMLPIPYGCCKCFHQLICILLLLFLQPSSSTCSPRGQLYHKNVRCEGLLVETRKCGL